MLKGEFTLYQVIKKNTLKKKQALLHGDYTSIFDTKPPNFKW
jgi:hypothetical protein